MSYFSLPLNHLSLRRLGFVFLLTCILSSKLAAQRGNRPITWTKDGNSYTTIKNGSLVKTDVATNQETVLVAGEQLQVGGKSLPIASYAFSDDDSKMLIFTNTARVWRQNTRGDYWILNRNTKQLRQIGKDKPSQSLMFAKISPDGTRVAYVSERNIYVENIANGQTTALTTDGTRKRINGTFDWVYEEELDCRDGFRWSPDGQKIAYWQVDASGIRDYLMLNTTDSLYSFVVPVEYPKVGEAPSPTRVGVVSASGGPTTWLAVPGDPQQNYLARMEWIPATQELIVQQLNRKQNESQLYICQSGNGTAQPIYKETSTAWIDAKDEPVGWHWLEGGKSFVWVSEKDGWRHIYKLTRDGKKETLLTTGKYDIASISRIDEATNYVYFIASPNNPIQRYLYRVKMDGKGKLEQLSPASLAGTHSYNISPNAKWATHSFSNYKTFPAQEWISLPSHKPLKEAESIAATSKPSPAQNLELFTVTTDDGVTLNGWMAKPVPFDSTKKYPVVFYVYGEPATTTTNDVFGAGSNRLFDGDMAKEGYCYIALDNRGTPNLKGAAWRKAIYRQIGRLNIRDQAMGAKKLFQQRSYLDTSRVAVWGWSGGGSTTLHLLFQYPDIYKTGISVAAVGNQLFYDNIYQERYMGLPQENREDFVAGSPVTYAKNLRGNLLYIHGTGDDNVHYSNAEVLINELIKHNKQFQVMPYPNRTHGISEGAGTNQHLRTLFTRYLKEHCPPGAR
ncbi:S9 family peptidase [Tellurirhabdus bombi]|uniref:S9 family peptidase n=1 Tax=Tellurirhabdus bombi TaxID=2907205 RepID=UPI001F379159|nr:S9 family peptidase [Tellurirhabdus bombi]